MNRLPVIQLNGFRADSLGVYLASLGLLSLTARQWPSVRACWRNACFCLVGGPDTLEQVVGFVGEIGERAEWSLYERPWEEDKKADVKGKTSTGTARWRALEAEEQFLPIFGAHLALDGRVRMNPLLGTGGNAGKRDFAKGWKKAVEKIEKPPQKQSRDALNSDLKAFLSGGACAYLDGFNAGSWFGADNKIYNHGNPSAPANSPRRGRKQPYREGEITPWAMTLACEGLPYFSGSSSRQLGSRRQPKGAFPFVTTAMAPRSAEEAGSTDAEVWVPIWRQPMTEPELKSLFLRGRTEMGGKGATSSAEFSVSVMGRGVDAGATEFRRFLFLHTTSAQTFESRLANVVPVPRMSLDIATTGAIQSIVEFRDTLPSDRKVGKRWRISGLRGPLEQALIDFAVTQMDEGSTEQAWALVDEMFTALAKVDRNRTFRSHNVRFKLLPGEWATKLLRDNPPDRESRLALAISSLAGTQACPQLVAHRIGVRKEKGHLRWKFSDSTPSRRVWSDTGLTENLCATADRRIMEELQKAASRPPFGAAIRVELDDIHAWLSGEVDEERVRLWLDRLCLFNWGDEADKQAASELQNSFTGESRPSVDGALALYALFRPLASDWLFRQVLHEGDIQTESISTCASLGRVVAMLRREDVNAAAEVALATYRSAGVSLADFDAPFNGPDPDRLLAALLIPVRDKQVLSVFRRWRKPTDPREP